MTLNTNVIGLVPGVAYEFRVVATNLSGSAASATISTLTGASLPGTVTGLTQVGTSGNNDVTLRWTAPTTGSPPTSYQVSYRTPSGSGAFIDGPTTTATQLDVTGLDSGVTYDFTVAAINAAGTGPDSAILANITTLTTTALPSAPRNIASETITSTSVVVTWTAPPDTGVQVTYILQYRVSGATTWIARPSVLALTDTVSGLTPLTAYEFSVTASNVAGTGPLSATLLVSTLATPIIIPTTPGPLQFLSSGSSTMTIRWTASASGTPPVLYQVQFTPTGTGAWANGPLVSVLTAQIIGLTDTTTYDVRVYATNSAGNSSPTATLTAATTPPAVLVTWNPGSASVLMALSNSNLTATATGAASQSCLSTTSLPSGSASFQVTFTGVSARVSVGLATSSYVVPADAGANVNSLAFYPSTGVGARPALSAWRNISNLFTPSGNVSAGDVVPFTISVLVDRDAGLFWVQTPAMVALFGPDTWNDNAAANPQNGVGGAPIGMSGGLFILLNALEAGAIATLNAGSSAFTTTGGLSVIPAQFAPWSGVDVAVFAPGAVAALTTNSPTSSSMGLSWTAPATGTPPYTYSIEFKLATAPTWTIFGTTLTTASTVTGLVPSTSYNFRVRASNISGVGSYSNTATASTPAQALTPLAPIGVVLTAATQLAPVAPTGPLASAQTTTTLKLSWNAVIESGGIVSVLWQPPSSGPAPTGYQLQYKLTSSSIWLNAAQWLESQQDTEIALATAAAATPTGLIPSGPSSSTINLSWSAVTLLSGSIIDNAGNAFSLTDGGQISITPPPIPKVATIDAVTSNVTLLVYWSDGLWQLNNAANWYMYLGSPGNYTVGTTNDPRVTIASNTAFTQVISGLAVTTSYDFQVQAFNAAGSGPFSSPVKTVVT